ncbi:outer membrane lipoprotein-sorting protein [Stackebrandtia albiflava]|uniref:Outer membrane lipoprotein-sorting protein n=1 Tax=Stackebrandtia albiflava TaxID=406432 RepID=A0A562UQM3_9ACTN|nr:outer membrane lipoprotein carrier protein LolA [Stackebrandtia albiflava]TWJ07922.1 outer membrane lipoprotein-sorting protein [Stackebrandtia albiflava]
MPRHRTVRRFAVPASIAAVAIAVGAGAGIVSADDPPDLPDQTAAELLAAVQNSDIPGLSGTVVANMELGLPDLGSDGGLPSAGSSSIRMWYAAPDKVRVAFLDKLGETDVIRNGADVWTWDSGDNEAVHYEAPAEAADLPMWPPSHFTGASPMEAAEQALAAIEPDTEVTTDGTVELAGRAAYQLVLSPKDPDSLVGEIRLAIDADTGVPLSTQIIPVSGDEPAFEVAFSRIDFTVPDAENFTFTAPAGVTVTEGTDEVGDLWESGRHADSTAPRLVGEGWDKVAVIDFDTARMSEEATGEAPEVSGLLDRLPEVSGDWGSGRVLTSSLVSVLITDDGRLLVGAVTPERLYAVAATA